MKVTRPEPVSGRGHQAARYRILVHVENLFATLMLGEDVEIIVPALPEKRP
jgi:hypothetical protein